MNIDKDTKFDLKTGRMIQDEEKKENDLIIKDLIPDLILQEKQFIRFVYTRHLLRIPSVAELHNYKINELKILLREELEKKDINTIRETLLKLILIKIKFLKNE
tara:strand:+ start:30576 stop:30887 length:312 start_codon:yes stop_codon:yes gene_type:complete